MAKKKPVPAMYPKPETIKVAKPQKIVAVEKKRGKLIGITIAGSPPPELLAAAEIERRRLDLNERLKGYVQSCGEQIHDHCGERPKNIPAAKWKDFNQRVRLIRELPDIAPAEAHEALRALQTLNSLVDELVKAGDYPEAVERAICWAIDLGQLLQRNHDQRVYGEAVDVGRRNVRSRSNANSVKSQKSEDKSQLAETEFNRLIASETQSRMRSATLANMAAKKDHNGKPMYGSLPTLKRYAKTWKSITPPE
jgi:hypothetical protein